MQTVRGSIKFNLLPEGQATALAQFRCPNCCRRHKIAQAQPRIVDADFNERVITGVAPCGENFRILLLEECQLRKSAIGRDGIYSVYFLLAPNVDLIRIGSTESEGNRLADHRANNAVDVEFYAIVQNFPTREIALKAETNLHRRFQVDRHHASWYFFSKIKDELDDLLSDPHSFDVSSSTGDWRGAIVQR